MSDQQLRILSLGDSYTIGEGVAYGERWPVRVAQALRLRGYDVDDPFIVADTGWTADELLAAIDARKPDPCYDFVSVLVGVNNQYRNLSVPHFGVSYSKLLGQAVEFAEGKATHVLALSIPDWSVTPFAEGKDREKISQSIDEHNTVIREESWRAGVHFVDVTPASKKGAKDASLLTTDGLHPSGKMYRMWAKLVLPVVLQEIKRDKEDETTEGP